MIDEELQNKLVHQIRRCIEYLKWLDQYYSTQHEMHENYTLNKKQDKKIKITRQKQDERQKMNERMKAGKKEETRKEGRKICGFLMTVTLLQLLPVESVSHTGTYFLPPTEFTSMSSSS